MDIATGWTSHWRHTHFSNFIVFYLQPYKISKQICSAIAGTRKNTGQWEAECKFCFQQQG